MLRNLILTVLLFFAGISCSPEGKGRIVSLAPSADEIIVAIGGKDALVGVSTYSKVKGITVVGDLINPDYERIVALKPDVVIVVLPMQNRVAERLKKLGLRTYNFSPESVGELIEEIRNLGRLVNREEEAEALADSVKRVVSSIKPKGRFTYYVEISSKPVFVAGDGTYISDVINRFGGKNLFSHIGGYAPVSTEEILSRDPDIVFTTQKTGKRIGVNSCVVYLKHDYVAPGLSIFPLVKTLERKIDSCLSIRAN